MKFIIRFAAAVAVISLLALGGIALADAEAHADVRPCAAYEYLGTRDSLCDRFGERADVDCAEIGYRVTLVTATEDPWDLDGLRGGDRGVVGQGCETYPRRPVSATQSAEPTPGGVTDTTQLPKTGPGAYIGFGVGATAAGTALVVLLAHRRRVRFVS